MLSASTADALERVKAIAREAVIAWLHFVSLSGGEQIFTAQCTLVQMRGLGIACRPSVRPSVYDVGDL